MKQIILLLSLLILSNETLAQDYTYSFSSDYKAFQKVDSKREVIDYSLWKPTKTKVEITKGKCTIIENDEISEYEIISSEIFTTDLTSIVIKASKSNNNYELELLVIDKNKFMFFVEDGKGMIEIYKTNMINKILN